jgi:arylsulfatase A-like enzyme
MTGHGGRAYQELVWVPLIMRWPRGLPAGTVVDASTQMLDITATVLDAFGLAQSEQHLGLSVLGLAVGETDPAFDDRPILAHGADTLALRRGDMKLMAYLKIDRARPPSRQLVMDSLDGAETRLFDLADDPGETIDLAAENPELVEELWGELAAQLELQQALAAREATWHIDREAAVTVDPRDIERLKALGYIEPREGADD